MGGSGVFVLRRLILIISILITLSYPTLSITLHELKLEILSQVAHGLFNKKKITIYLADNSFIDKKTDTNKLGIVFVDNCSSADLIVAGSLKHLSKNCLKKTIFATNYPLFRDRHTIGALFWQKGRPVLILKKRALERRGLRVKDYLEKYVH